MIEMSGREILTEWYLGQMAENMEYIRMDQGWISALNEFREKYQHNWRIVEACRELIFYHTKEIQEEVREIERLRKNINEPS